MSCGQAHELPCEQIVAAVYFYLDGEDCQITRELIGVHLGECAPCNEEYSLENRLKSLIAQAFSSDIAPQELRSLVIARLSEIQVDPTAVQEHP